MVRQMLETTRHMGEGAYYFSGTADVYALLLSMVFVRCATWTSKVLRVHDAMMPCGLTILAVTVPDSSFLKTGG